MNNAMIEPYQDLADAIILRAVKDYRNALKKLKEQPFYRPAQNMKNEVERFFRSDWYIELTSVDGEILIKKLQAEAEEIGEEDCDGKEDCQVYFGKNKEWLEQEWEE